MSPGLTCRTRLRSHDFFECVDCTSDYEMQQVDNVDTENAKISTEVTAEALVEYLNAKIVEKPK